VSLSEIMSSLALILHASRRKLGLIACSFFLVHTCSVTAAEIGRLIKENSSRSVEKGFGLCFFFSPATLRPQCVLFLLPSLCFSLSPLRSRLTSSFLLYTITVSLPRSSCGTGTDV
jgi:hypothetical protein